MMDEFLISFQKLYVRNRKHAAIFYKTNSKKKPRIVFVADNAGLFCYNYVIFPIDLVY